MVARTRTLLLTKTGSEVWRAAADLDGQGFPTVSADSLASALAASTDLRVDAAIIDCSDPLIDPVVAAAAIRAQSTPRMVPVLAVGPRERVMNVDWGQLRGPWQSPFTPCNCVNGFAAWCGSA